MIPKLEADSVEEAEQEINNYSGVVGVQAFAAPGFECNNPGTLTEVTLKEFGRYARVYESLWKEVSEASDLVEIANEEAFQALFPRRATW